MYSNSVLNNWYFFRDILSLFLSRAFSRSANFTIYAPFQGVNSNESSIIDLQCFLLCKHSKIVFIYDFQIEGDIFNPISIL